MQWRARIERLHGEEKRQLDHIITVSSLQMFVTMVNDSSIFGQILDRSDAKQTGQLNHAGKQKNHMAVGLGRQDSFNTDHPVRIVLTLAT